MYLGQKPLSIQQPRLLPRSAHHTLSGLQEVSEIFILCVQSVVISGRESKPVPEALQRVSCLLRPFCRIGQPIGYRSSRPIESFIYSDQEIAIPTCCTCKHLLRISMSTQSRHGVHLFVSKEWELSTLESFDYQTKQQDNKHLCSRHKKTKQQRKQAFFLYNPIATTTHVNDSHI